MSEDRNLKAAIRAAQRICFASVFHVYPWLKNQAVEMYTEVAEGYFGTRFITTSPIKWREYLTYLYTLSFSPTKNIDVSGSATLTGVGDIAGINLTSSTASLTRSNANNIIIYYEGLTSLQIDLIYKSVTYSIPINLGRNYLAIAIYTDIIVIDETGGTTNISITNTTGTEEFTLNMTNIKLFGLNLFNNLDNLNLVDECNNIKALALKRIKQ